MKKAYLLFLLLFTFSLFGQVATFPYAEGWETGIPWTQSTADNLNWTQRSGSTGSSSTGPASANEGSSYVYVETSGSSSGNTAILEQDFDLSLVTNPYLSFDYHMYFAGSALGGTLKVDVSTDAGTSWCNLWSKSGDQGTAWLNDEALPLDGYSFATIRLRFHFTVGTNITYQNDVALDDIKLIDAASASSCQPPICFSESNLQPFSIDLSWSAVSMASSAYNVIYGATGFDPQTAGTAQAMAASAGTVSGLSAGTSYDFYVYSNCGASNSDTVGPLTVMTALTCQTPTAVGVANISPTSLDLVWTAGGTETTWDVEYGSMGFTQGAGTTLSGVTTNPYPLSGLSSSTSYDYYVRADCGVNGSSPWAGPFSFTTAFQCPPNAVCGTYTSGDIDSDFSFTSLPGASTCAGSMVLAIPSGDWVDSADVSYDMTAQGGAWQSEQITWMYSPTSGGGEPAVISGPSINSAGTASYARTSLSFANTATGSVTVELHAGRSWGGSGCNTTYNKIDDGTWLVVLYHSIAPSCTPSNNLSAANILANSADLSWTSTGTEALWNIEYGISGFTQGTGTMVTGVTTNTNYNLAGLTADANYDYYVQADCGASQSLWSSSFSFTTPCTPFTTPYSQNFDGETAPAINSCWSVINTVNLARLGTDATPLGTAANSAPNAVEFYNYTSTNPTDQILVSPMFSDLDNTKRIRFFLYDYSNTSDFIVGTMSDPNNAATFTSFDTITEAEMGDDVWEQFTISFASYTGTDKYIAFSSGANTTFDYIHFDDFQYEDIPTCPDPSLLLTSNVGSVSVDLAWTENGTATAWQVSYGAVGASPAAGTKVLAATNPYSLTGLAANTAYSAFVRSICAPGDTSPWTSAATFTTSCLPFTAPYTESFDANSVPACWSISATTGGPWSFTSPGFSWNTTGCGAGPNDNTGNAGNYAALDHSSGDAGVIMALNDVDVSGLTSPYMSFYYWMCGSGYTPLNILYLEAYDGTSWNSVDTIQQGTAGWELFGYDVSTFTYGASLVRLRFRSESGGSGSDFYGDQAIDDVSIIEAPNCPDPSSVILSNLAQTSADFDWTENGTASAWDVEYGAAGFSPTGVPTASSVAKPYSLTGLSGATSYDFYVRSDCGVADGTSSWVGPLQFTTPPDTALGVTCASGVLSVLFSEDFENNSAGWTGSINSGNGSWEIPDGASSSGTGASSGFGGGNFMNYEASNTSNNNGSIVSPAIDLSGAINQAELSFYMHAYGASMGTLNVGVGTSAAGPFTNEFTWTGPYQTLGGDDWINIGVDLSGYLGSTIFLQFTQYDTLNSLGSGFDGDMSIDALTVTSCVSCPAPTAFTSNNVGVTTVDLAWTEIGSATSWLVEFGAPGFTPGSGTTVSSSTNPYTLTGLTQNSSYDIYLRSFCAVGDTSARVGPISINTQCASITAYPYTQTFDGLSPNNGSISCTTSDALGDCWSNEATATKDWVARSSSTGSSNTGPTSDNTGGGNYVFLETSSCYNRTADLYSPVFDFTAVNAPRIRYAFHMYGAAMGSLELAYSTDSGATWSAAINSISGDQGNQWLENGALLLSLAGETDVIFRFRGITGLNFTSDMAVDDVIVDDAPMNEVGVTALSLAGDGCGTNQVVTIDVTNFGAATQTSLPVSYELNGSIISATWTGSISPGASSSFSFVPTLDLSAAGSYTIKAFTNLGTDADNSNDTSTTTIVTAATYSAAYRSDFEAGLPADWTTDGSLTTAHNAPSTVLFRNLWNGSQSFTATSSKVNNIVAGDVLRFAYRYVDFSAGTNASSLGAGDSLKVYVSADCGLTFTLIDTVHQGNHSSATSMSLKEYDLSAYSGQTVMVKFDAVWGTGDYFLDLDEFFIGTPLSSSTAILSSYNGSDISCLNASDASAQVTAAGGVTPYTYLWDAQAGAQTTAIANGLDAVMQYVTVTDAQGYTITDSISPVEPDTIAVSVLATNPSCAANADGILDLTITGGTTPYTITWSDGGFTSEDRTALGIGTYSITITDANGCSYADSYTLIDGDTSRPTSVCQDVTVYLDASGNATITPSDVNAGSSDNCSVSTFSLSQTSFTCADVPTRTVTLTVTDQAGNASTCTSTITVIDTISPTVITQDLTVYLNHSGLASISAVDLDNGSTDICGINSFNVDKSSFDCSDVGSNTVVLTVMDVNGNSNTSTATVTVIDSIPPTSLCQNLTVFLDASGIATITPSDVNAGSFDNCSVSTLSLSDAIFTCADVGGNTVTLTVGDVNNNFSTCTAFITVVDSVPPTSICQDVTVYLDASGIATITPSDVNAGSNDNCSVSTLSLSDTIFNCADVGGNTVTLTVGDANNNFSTCTSTITVIDTISPTVITQDLTVYLNHSGLASISAVDLDNGSTDFCGINSFDVDKANFDCSDVGSNTVVLTVMDVNGNSNTSTATVTVIDSIPPTSLCQNLTVFLDASGIATITPSDVNAGSFDNCSVSTLSLSDTIFTCADVGGTTVTLTVGDVNNNFSTCTSTITVVDTISPTIITQDLNVYLDGNGQASVTANDADNGSSDNCQISTKVIGQTNFDCDDLGANIISFIVTDINGNQSNSTFTLTVLDTISPTITTRTHTAYLDANGDVSIDIIDVSSGTSNACSIDTVFLDKYDFDCSDVGSNTVVVSAQAAGGSASNSASATVLVVDTVSPVVNTQSLIMYLDAGGQASITAAMVNGGSADACGIATLSIDNSNFDCDDLGSNTVVLTVTDVNGNSATNTAVIEVRDTITPIAVSRDLTVYLDASGSVTISAITVNNGSTDNCAANPSLSQSTFTCSDEGLNQEYLIITDADGNVDSTDFLITVLDTLSPIVITRNITIQLGATGTSSISPNQLDSASSDNCSNQLFYTASKTSFSCADLGTNTVTLTATDVQGNVTTRLATVTVEDNIAPTVQTQSVILSLDASGNATLSAAMINNGSSDNCAIDSMWISKTSFDCSNLGSNSVQLWAEDESGNKNSSSVIITVQDLIAPVAIGKNVTIYLDASGSASLNAGDVNNGSTDNCTLSTMSISASTFGCSNIGANAVNLTVGDASGNSNSTAVTVTVMDTIAPSPASKNITVALDANGNASILASDVNDGSSDACGIASMVVSPSNFNCSNLGLNLVTLTVTDNNGNQATIAANVQVEDNRAPIAVAQNVTVFLDASGNAVIIPADVDNGSSDNCGISTYTLSKTAFTCSDLGNNAVVLSLADASGNSANITATVTVIDTMKPAVATQNITVYLSSSGSTTISAGMIDNLSSDNCSVSSLSLSKGSFDCSNIGLNVIHLTATDGTGNSASASATVTVLDTISPTALAQNITVTLDANGNASILSSDINNGSSDACGISSLALSKTSFNCSDIGSNTVTLTVTDNSNNISLALATVTVVDAMAPSVLIQNVTIYLDANGTASTTAMDVNNGSSDNCGVSSLSLNQNIFGCSDLGTNTVTLTVMDASGNSASSNAIVTVLDTVSPVMLAQNINAYLDANGVVSISSTLINNGSSDNCGISGFAISQASFTCVDVGPNTVLLTGTDGSGNSSTASAVVTVIDTISPSAVAQNLTISLDASGNASISASNISAGSSDACGISTMSVSPSSFDCTDLGANTVTLTVTDINNNTSTASSTIMVEDNIAPTVVTQVHTVYLDATGSATMVAADINNGSTDNCSIATYALNLSSFDCSNVGQNLVTLTVTDVSGNSASGGAIVTVLDTISPSLTNIPTNITAYSGANQCGTTVTWPTIGGTDNCSVSGISASISSGSFFNKGTTTISLTINDPSGNSSSNSFTVTVLDTIAPVFTSGVSGINIVPNPNSCDAVVTWNSPTASDNCSAVSYTFSQASGSVFPVGSTTVTVTATDADGNNRSSNFNVVVTDQLAPTISNVPANLTVSNDAGSCDAVVSYATPTVTDNCAGATIATSHASGSTFPVGTTLVTFTATDAAGNISNASFEITVEDQEAPVFTMVPANDTVGQCGQIYSYSIPTGSDNCSGLLTVRQIAGLPPGSFYPPGVTTNIFEITDVAGNSTTASFSIVVVPQGLPQLPSLIEACVNDAAVNITLGQSIVWSGNGIVNGGTVFNPGVAGTGRHSLGYVFTDSMGCTVAGNITITVLPKPSVPLISQIGSATLQTGVYNTYQWFRDGVLLPGATLQSYTYTVSGNYQVEVSNTVGCFTYSAGFVVGSSGGGIGLQDLDLTQLEVYPNPNSGKFNIQLNAQAIEDLHISVYSMDGRKLYENDLQTEHDGKVQVDVGHLPTANYFLYIRTADQVAVRKILMK